MVASNKKDETKLPLLTSNKTSMLMASEKRKTDEGTTIQARHKSFQASSTLTSGKFSTSFDVSNSNQPKPSQKMPTVEKQSFETEKAKNQKNEKSTLANVQQQTTSVSATTATTTKGKKEAENGSKPAKKKRRFKAKKLVLNVSQTKYNIVRYVARNQFKMRLSGAPYMADY